MTPEIIPLPPSPTSTNMDTPLSPLSVPLPESRPPSPPLLTPEQPASAKIDTPPWERSKEEQDAFVRDLLCGETSTNTDQLPDLIKDYEEHHATTILSDQNYAAVRLQCTQNTGMNLEPEEVLALLRVFGQSPQVVDAHPDVTSPLRSSSRQTSRRVSDRIKSPSDSSDTSDEDLRTDDDNCSIANGESSEPTRRQRPVSARLASSTGSDGRPSSSSYALPASDFGSPVSKGNRRPRPPPVSYSRQSSTAPDDDSPLSARVRGEQLTQGYGNIGFAKPLAPHHRRRASRDASGHSADDHGYPDVSKAAVYKRTVSASSAPSSRGRSDSPTSPLLDDTSFHAVKSPPYSLDPADDSFLNGDASEEPEGYDLHDDRLLSADMRISKLSTGSSTSLNARDDKVLALERQIEDSNRKRKDAERAVLLLGQHNDQLLADLQDKLDEAYDELAQRKKEQAEYKGKERAQTTFVKKLESEVEVLRRQLDETRSGQADALKRQQQVTENSAKLAEELAEKQEENANLMKEKQRCDTEVVRLEAQIQFLEEQMRHQAAEFEQGEKAKTELAKQKAFNQLLEAENAMLKSNSASRALSPDLENSLSAPGGSAGPSTLGRNLGAEFARQMGSDDDDDEGGVVEQTVTTRIVRRAARRHSRKPSDSLFEPPEEETVEDEVEIRNYTDSATQSDPILMDPSPPAYSPKDDAPKSPQEILELAHPIREGSTGSLPDDDNYRTLVKASGGMRCKMYEEELLRKRAADGRPGLNRKRSQTYSGPSPAERGEGLANLYKWGMTGAAFAAGIVVGGMWLTGSGPSRGDIAVFTKVNTIAMAAGGYGEGIFPQAMVRHALDQGFWVPT